MLTHQFKNNLHKEILKLCHSMNLRPHNYVRGCKLFNNYQRVAVLILYIRSGKSLRTFSEEFGETKWPHWFQMKKIPSKSTIHHWLKTFSTGFIRKLLYFSIENSTPTVVGVDGSSIDTDHKSSYYKKRIGFKNNAPWHKLDIICDLEGSKQIIDFSFLLKQKHDIKVARQIFKRFRFKNLNIVADKGYYCFDLFSKARKKRNALIVPPKNYGKKCRHKNIIRDKFHATYYQKEQIYPKRNNVESVFSSLKRVQGLRLRSKLSFMKKREIAWNMLWYNIRKKISSYIPHIIRIIFFYYKLSFKLY